MGLEHPASGVPALGVVLLAFGLVGCGDNEMSRLLEPNQVAMTKDVAPIYDDGELTLYEVKRGIDFPILTPSNGAMAALDGEPTEPYGRRPWITSDDVRVQLTWTLSNLDDEPLATWSSSSTHGTNSGATGRGSPSWMRTKASTNRTSPVSITTTRSRARVRARPRGGTARTRSTTWTSSRATSRR